MAYKVLNGLDLAQTAIINAVMHPLASAPASPVAGQVYFDSTLEKLGFYTGTAWEYVPGSAGSLTDLVDDTTPQLGGPLDTNGQTVAGRDIAADGSKLDGVTAGAQPTNATTVDAAGATMNTDIDLSGVAWFLNDGTMAAQDPNRVVSQQSVVTYVAAQLAGHTTSVDVNDYDAATNTPDLTGSPTGITKSDQFYVSTAGAFFTESVNPGDMLIARDADPTVLADWIIVRGTAGVATEVASGIARIATAAEVATGVNDAAFVTPLKLAQRGYGRKHAETIGDGATTALTVTHNLGSRAVTWSIRDTGTNEFVLTDVVATSTNALTLTFGAAPAVGQYEVTVNG